MEPGLYCGLKGILKGVMGMEYENGKSVFIRSLGRLHRRSGRIVGEAYSFPGVIAYIVYLDEPVKDNQGRLHHAVIIPEGYLVDSIA